MIMRLTLTIILWAFVALPLAAQDAATGQRMLDAFEGWMVENNAETGALAVRYRGHPYLQQGFGMDADAPVEMASLSKAITGICVSELIREGALSYDDPFSDVVGRGPDITVAQLLNQTGGLKKDSTQKSMQDWFGHPKDRASDVLDQIIARGGPQKKPGRFRYNNENYALLSLVIGAASGAPYQAACKTRVLDPAGVKAQPSPVSGAYLGWGGWQMSVDNYAAFLTHWFGPDSYVGRGPVALANTQLQGGAHYGHGMFFRAFRGGFNFWHHGALCFPGRLNIGSFAVSWMGEWSAVAAYDICPDNAEMGSLDATLSRAAFQ